MMNFVSRMLLVLLSMPAFAQQPAKVNIQGVVSAAGTNEPIAGARIALTRSMDDPIISDSRGRFEFKNLDARDYWLSIMANGYVRQDIPATSNISIRMTPAGIVSGRLLETSGRPAANVPVELLHREYTRQGRALQEYASTKTNDLGEYRFYWVTPGRYYVVAGHKELYDVGDIYETGGFDQQVLNGQNNVAIGYDYTYWPGIGEVERASLLDIQPGARIEGLDFTVSRLHTYRIQGHVIDATTGRPPLRLNFTGLAGAASSSYDPKTGIFEYAQVLPGRHAIAIFTDGRQASALVVVGNSDVEGLSLTLRPSPEITGKVRVEGGGPLPENGPNRIMRVNLRPKDPRAAGGGSVPFEADGNFMFDELTMTTEPYRVELSGLPAGFYVREARLGGIDVLNEFSSSFSRPGNLEIVVSSKVGQVKGVTKARVQVILIPDKFRSRPDLYRMATTDGSGRFTLSNVEPGDYKLFAWERIEPYAWLDAEFLEPFEQQGMRVHVSESSEQSVELRVLPAGATP